jgi:hypothetical protein
MENSIHKTIRLLKKLQLMRAIEQADTAGPQSIEESPPAKRHRNNLKKQSQFASAMMGTKSCAAKDYGDRTPAPVAGNRANEACPQRGRTGQIEEARTTQTAVRA